VKLLKTSSGASGQQRIPYVGGPRGCHAWL